MPDFPCNVLVDCRPFAVSGPHLLLIVIAAFSVEVVGLLKPYAPISDLLHSGGTQVDGAEVGIVVIEREICNRDRRIFQQDGTPPREVLERDSLDELDVLNDALAYEMAPYVKMLQRPGDSFRVRPFRHVLVYVI